MWARSSLDSVEGKQSEGSRRTCVYVRTWQHVGRTDAELPFPIAYIQALMFIEWWVREAKTRTRARTHTQSCSHAHAGCVESRTFKTQTNWIWGDREGECVWGRQRETERKRQRDCEIEIKTEWEETERKKEAGKRNNKKKVWHFVVFFLRHFLLFNFAPVPQLKLWEALRIPAPLTDRGSRVAPVCAFRAAFVVSMSMISRAHTSVAATLHPRHGACVSSAASSRSRRVSRRQRDFATRRDWFLGKQRNLELGFRILSRLILFSK